MWLSIFSYSILVSEIKGCHCWVMIAHYFGTLFILYCWHWQAHQNLSWVPFNKECRRLHNEHHFKTYPPSKYFGKDVTKLEVTHDSFFTQHEMLMYSMLVVQLVIGYYIGEKFGPLAGVFIFAVVGAYIANYLHQSFHVKGHFLERYGWFHELRAVHYIHHLHSTRHNYAVLNVGLDWMCGSLVLEEALKDSDDEG